MQGMTMNKHTATFAGHTFTRNSKTRKYSHLVLALNTFERDRAAVAKRASNDYKTNRDYHAYIAQQTPGVEYRTFSGWYTQTSSEEVIAASKRISAQSHDEYVAAALAYYEARTDKSKLKLNADGTGYYTELGWTSRPDLATKLSNSQSYGRQTFIVEATIL